MSIDSLKSDLASAIKRLEKNPATDLNTELRYNLYPLLKAITDEISDLDGSVDSLADSIDQEGSYIEPELGVAIFTAFGVAQSIIDDFRRLQPGDELEKKRIEGKIAEWTEIHQAVAHDIAEAMPDGDDDEEDDELLDGDTTVGGGGEEE